MEASAQSMSGQSSSYQQALSYQPVDEKFEALLASQKSDFAAFEREQDRYTAFDTIVATQKLFDEFLVLSSTPFGPYKPFKERYPDLFSKQCATYLSNRAILTSMVAELWVDHLDQFDGMAKVMMRSLVENGKDSIDYSGYAIFIECAQKALAGQKEYKGIIWDVSTDHTTHSLIGTVHCGMKGMLESRPLLSALDRSEVFYAEAAHYSEKDKAQSYKIWQQIGYEYTTDIAIIELLKDKQKEVRSLEPLDEGSKALALYISSMADAAPSLTPSKYMSAQFENPSFILGTYLMARAWQLGDECVFEKLILATNSLSQNSTQMQGQMEGAAAIFDHRTERWCQEHDLPNLLKTSKEPICLFVGAGHYFGEHGLLKIFRDGGLTVKRVE